MKYFEQYKKSNGYVLASCRADFTDGDGDNPPQIKARKEYEKIIDAGHFLCSHEYPNTKTPEPIKFELSDSGLSLIAANTSSDASASKLTAAVVSARGGQQPPQQQVGFGIE
jgi:hypothetical protein